MLTVLHICPAGHWERVPVGGHYRADSLVEEGFVHCSDRGTVHLPANRLYVGRTDLVLLEIDIAGLEVRWEPPVRSAPTEGPWFPHVYEPIPSAAVVAVHEFQPDGGGLFHVPESLAVSHTTNIV